MKKTFKRISALLALVLCLSAVSCTGSKDGKGTAEYVKIVDAGVTQYRIVRSDTNDIGGSAAAKLRGVLQDLTGEKVVLMNDFEHEKLGTMRIDTEILVGPTTRDESTMHEREFTYLDYAIDMDTTRLSITGGSAEALGMAVQYIADNFVDAEAKTLAVPKGTVVEYLHDYPIDSFTIGGANFEDFVFVCAEGDDRAASLIRQLRPLYGKSARVEYPIYKDKSECEVIFSSANDERYEEIFAQIGDFEYSYKVEGTKVYIGANKEASDDLAWNMFLEDMLGGDVSALKGDIKITDCEKVAEVDHAQALEATPEFLADIDAKAEALKETIMNSPNMEIPEGAIVYYVSPNGSDSNNGKTPETALRSLTAVNNIEFPRGSYVLFERGGIWRGQIAAKPGVTYSAYGEGAKPALYGGHEDGAKPEKWSLMEGTDNIWIYADEMIDSGTLVFNGGEMVAYKEIPTYRDGRFVKRSAPEEEFNIIEWLDVDLDFFHEADSILHDGKYPASGSATGKIYLRCDAGNPGKVFDSIEFLPRRNGFAIGGDNITIDNFTIKYIGAHGVGSGTRTGLTVTNCELGWIGGGIQSYAANGNTTQSATRFGNAIEIYGGCHEFNVNHNYIYQVYDAGITHQYKSESKNIIKMEKVDYSYNLVENCIYSIEYFLDSFGKPEQKMYDNKMHDNILRFAGFGWGNQRPDKGSPAHIKGWDHENPAEDFEIYNNIMDRGSNWLIHCGYTNAESEPKVYGNTFIQYSDGLFGRYAVNPTKVIPYGNAMLMDERLRDNTFYFIYNESVPSFIGDRGSLSLKVSGLPAYREGEYIELHGDKMTSASEIAEVTAFFNEAHTTAALFTGFGGETTEEAITYNEADYVKLSAASSLDELLALAEKYFLSDRAKAITEQMVDDDHPLFVEKDGALYRYSGYVSQYAYTDADVKAVDCYKGYDGTVSLRVEATFENTTAQTVYKMAKGEDGSYRITSAFALPIEIALRAMNG
ncbi:MAG: right-handed parallel beta-helix repeat-containing protein [Clostridia bacterium]|nr:right-handed parallel beta-helix repeat-containing protein [Clostridia bacterium]